MEAAVFSKYAHFVQIGRFDQDRETERSGGIVIECHIDTVGAWEILRTEMLTGIVGESAYPLGDLFLPASW